MKGVATALSVAVLVVGVTALGAAAARTTATSRSMTFHLVEKQIGSNFIDNPPRQGRNGPPLIGDQFAFTDDVRTRSGAHVGWLYATCMVTRGGVNGGGTCYGTYAFKGGQLAGIAKLSFVGNVTDAAIVGGTGVYEGASGTSVSVSRGQNSPYSDDTIHLLLP